MCNISRIWLFVVLLPCFVIISDSSSCSLSVFDIPNTQIVASSELNTYEVTNLKYGSPRPWVSNFTDPKSNKSIYVEFHFGQNIFVDNIYMTGGEVKNFKPGMCYVTRFAFEYKNNSNLGNWSKFTNIGKPAYKKFDTKGGIYNGSIGLNEPVTDLKILIRKWNNCPAVNLELLGCVICTHLPHKAGQSLDCIEYNNIFNKTCTYACKPGYKQSDRKSGEKICNLNGEWTGDDIQCDFDECQQSTAVCDLNAICKDSVNRYSCTCKSGFSGNGDPGQCKDIDECRTHNCHKDASCTNTKGSFKCTCKDGFVGDGIKNCKDFDECQQSTAVCDSNAICKDSVNRYSCTCKSGYIGDGNPGQCKDIDECRENPHKCHMHASCKNTMGSFDCTCNDGFDGDGITKCKDIDECRENPHKCHMYATCTNTKGSFNCTCNDGFDGDGITKCKGDAAEIIDHSRSQTVRFGVNLEIFCQAEGLPLPPITWSVVPPGQKNAERVSDNVTSSTMARVWKSTLRIDRITLEDSGIYICTATNSYNSVEKKINISVDGKPSSPNANVVVVNVRSLVVSWIKPNRGASAIKGYTIYYVGETEDSKDVNNATLKSELMGLIPNTTYTIWVVAINEQGKSNAEIIKETTNVPKPPASKPPQQDTSSSSKTSVVIMLAKLDSEYISFIQVIIGRPSSRKKRSSGNVPEMIHNYSRAFKNGDTHYITAQLENKDDNFIVGDGKTYNGYLNHKLEPGKSYSIFVRGVALNSKKERRYGDPSDALLVSVKGNTSSDSAKVGLAVGLTVMIVVLIVLVVLAVLYVRSRQPQTLEIDPETGKKKRHKRSFNSELLPLNKKGTGKRKSSSVEDGTPDPNHPPVTVAAFAKHVAKLHKSDDRGFMIQYNTLETSQTYSSETAQITENKEKNRYANIIAYDVSRVHLKKIGDDDHSDYINASQVDGYNAPNTYLATQGPVALTFNDFWRMVWEKNCSAVVMLTNLQERHKIKCHKYWPEDSETYGDITVTATRREEYADYVIRSFFLKMHETEEEREIKQFHFTVWPDHGVPEYPTAILAFQRRVRAYSSRDSGPLVVHCSAGVGRSGTFIVIDSMLARMQIEQTLDIYNYVRYLRTRRMFMVQTEEQYVFCHDALLESILCGNTQIAAHNLRIEINKRKEKDPTTKITGFEVEFKTLNKVSPILPKECFVVASYPDNASKNRYPDVLASDHGRVMLMAIDDKDITTYINAVFVDGYKQQNAFIITQSPLTETVDDFWRMLYEKRSACVVLLSDLTEKGDFPTFWPEDGTGEYGLIKVELVTDASRSDTASEDQFQQERSSNDLVERKLKLTKSEEKPLVVKIFQYISWQEDSVPPDISGMVSLIQRIEKWQQHSGNGSITVACNDGLGRSGTFAALCSVLERVKTEQVVDVFQTIKALRIQRPGLVKDVDQYQFIHFGVQEYLDSFSDYANFK